MDIFGGAQRELLHMQAERNYNSSNFEKAKEQYLELLNHALKAKDTKAAKYADRLGDCYEKLKHGGNEERIKDHQNAAKFYIKAADMFSKLGDNEKAGEIFGKGARAYEEIDDFKSAGGFYIESANMFSKSGDYVNASYAYHSAAEYFEKDEEWEKASQAYMESSICDLRVHDTSNASICFKKAAKDFERLKNWKKAIDNYASSVELDTMNRKYLDIADTHDAMAKCYYEIGDMKNTVHYHLRSADLRMANKDKHKAGSSYLSVAKVMERAGEFEKAIEYYLKSAKTFFGSNNTSEEAHGYSKAAEMFEKLEEYEEAAQNFLEAARATRLGENTVLASEWFDRASQMFIKAASEKDDPNAAGQLLLKAAFSYREAEQYQKSAKTFNEYARVMIAAGKMDKAQEGFTHAAEQYLLSGLKWEAAESYVNYGDYETAAGLYEEYAKGKDMAEDEYGVAIAYKEAANCYRRLENESMQKTRLDKSISHFTRFLEKINEKKLTDEELVVVGDAYRKMAENEKMLDEFAKALPHLEKSQKLYEQVGDQHRKILSIAFTHLINGITSIDHGYYPKAEKELNEAVNLFNDSVESRVWKREYTKILKEHINESQSYLEKIMLKPDVVLEMDRRSYTFTNIPVLLNVQVENNGSYVMKDVSFLEHLPNHMKLTKLPRLVSEIPPKNMKRVAIEITPKKTGMFRIKPLEIYYEDQKGNRYVKSSAEVTMEVVEAPASDFANYLKATEIFKRYARSQQANKNWFQAGNGYREMAQIYGKFRSDEHLREYWNKSMECYLSYTQERRAEAVDDLAHIKRFADAHWYLGESYRNLKNLEKAAESYENSIKPYVDSQMTELVARSLAFKNKVEATKFIKVGDDTNAHAKLLKSLEFFDQAIKNGNLNDDEMNLLEKHEEDAKAMLENLKTKPQIRVIVSVDETARVGDEITFKADIENPLNYPIKNVKPVAYQQEGVIELLEKPREYDIIEAGETKTVYFKMRPNKKGVVKFKPIDLSYGDQEGKSYIKGSNEVEMQVAETKKTEHKLDLDEKGHVGVIFEIDRRSLTFTDKPLRINVTLENQGDFPLKKISFLEHIPNQMVLTKLPTKIESLDTNSSIETSIELKVMQAGEYRIKPIELYYEDPSGTRYIKASTEIAIECMEYPQSDFNNYIKAVDIYQRYTLNQAENKNWFDAADGYMHMAKTYSSFKTDEKLDSYLLNAIQNYNKYIEGADATPTTEKDERIRLASAYFDIGFARHGLKNLEQAAISFEESAKRYEDLKIPHQMYKAHALQYKMLGIKAIKSANPKLARENIEKSLENFQQANIHSSNFTDEELSRLQKDDDETKSILKTLEEKPGITVSFDYPKQCKVGEEIKVSVKVDNPHGQSIKNIRLIIKRNPKIEVVKNPDRIIELQVGSSEQTEFIIKIIREGNIKFHPLELTYTDSSNNNYQIGSDEIEINVVKGERVEEVMEEIFEEQPRITLKFPNRNDLEVSQQAVLEGKIENIGESDVFGIRFIGKNSDEIEIIEPPQPLNNLKAGEKEDLTITIKAKKSGSFHVGLLELFFKNVKGRRFFKSSEITQLTTKDAIPKAKEKPAKDDMEILAELSRSDEDEILLVTFDSNRHNEAVEKLMSAMVKGQSRGGVYINISQPTKTILERINEKNIPTKDIYFIDCITHMIKGESTEKNENITFIENPSSLEEITLYLDRMLLKVSSEKKFLFLDSLSSLLIYNNEHSVREFVHFIINKIRVKNIAGVILSIEKDEVEELVKTLTPVCDRHIHI